MRFEKRPREGLLLFAQLKNLFQNKKTKIPLKKTEGDVRLLERFLKTKSKDRKMGDIPVVELNQYISQFIISVRTKDGNEYKPNKQHSRLWTRKETSDNRASRQPRQCQITNFVIKSTMLQYYLLVHNVQNKTTRLFMSKLYYHFLPEQYG